MSAEPNLTSLSYDDPKHRPATNPERAVADFVSRFFSLDCHDCRVIQFSRPTTDATGILTIIVRRPNGKVARLNVIGQRLAGNVGIDARGDLQSDLSRIQSETPAIEIDFFGSHCVYWFPGQTADRAKRSARQS